jgi:hypothetical protein
MHKGDGWKHEGMTLRMAETAEFVNGEVLEILEGLIKVTLA